MSPTFTITASPGTDVWRKPPSTDIFNGMYLGYSFTPPPSPQYICPFHHFIYIYI